MDHTPASYLNVNIDLILDMPCKCAYHNFLLNRMILTRFLDLSVDLRNVVGDRLFLTRESIPDGVRIITLSTFLGLPNCCTDRVLHRTSYGTQVSRSRDVGWTSLMHSGQRTRPDSRCMAGNR